ncbi:MAG: signal recognition particle subunit SRP54 [Kiritimatiellia bacterium]
MPKILAKSPVLPSGSPIMFDNLSTSLQKTFKNLRGYGKLSEKNITDALREIRLALLEADVHFQVVKDFIQQVKEKTIGQEVLTSVSPGQQFTKCVQDELTELLGRDHKDFELSANPTMIMMLGLHGAGKTTTSGKLAAKFAKDGRKVLLVACDIRRPAAVDQLSVLASQVGVDIVKPNPGESVPELGMRARDIAMTKGYNLVIFDTGGRFQIDDELVRELEELKDMIDPQNVVLVIDAAMGQESVNVAQTFHDKVSLTGLILTKMDGDARGGAALSVQSVVGVPILLVGVGEKAEDLEDFYPDRLASRILGMGDIVSLVEKAQDLVDEESMAKMEQKLLKGDLNFEDMLSQMQQMKKLGPIDKLMEMMPGMPQVSAEERKKMADQSQVQSKRFEAIILSMTVKERRKPHVINAKRKQRIAKGAGTRVKDVNDLIKQFNQAKKMTEKLKKHQKKLLRFSK